MARDRVPVAVQARHHTASSRPHSDGDHGRASVSVLLCNGTAEQFDTGVGLIRRWPQQRFEPTVHCHVDLFGIQSHLRPQQRAHETPKRVRVAGRSCLIGIFDRRDCGAGCRWQCASTRPKAPYCGSRGELCAVVARQGAKTTTIDNQQFAPVMRFDDGDDGVRERIAIL